MRILPPTRWSRKLRAKVVGRRSSERKAPYRRRTEGQSLRRAPSPRECIFLHSFRSPKQACARAAPLSESHEIVATTGDQPGGGVASARERNLTTIASLARDHASPQTNTFDRSHQGAEASPSVRFRDAHHTVTASQGGRAHPTSKPQRVAV